MIVAAKQRGQVLILLGVWLLFGGGASTALIVSDRPVSAIKKKIKQVIAAGSRRDVILFDITQWESGQEKQDEEVNEGREELLKILQRKEAQRSELEPTMAKLDETLLAMDRNFLDLRFRVRGQVTSAEWAELVARPSR
jgi:hypothetical protein